MTGSLVKFVTWRPSYQQEVLLAIVYCYRRNDIVQVDVDGGVGCGMSSIPSTVQSIRYSVVYNFTLSYDDSGIAEIIENPYILEA